MLRKLIVPLMLWLATGPGAAAAAPYAWPLPRFAGNTSLFGDYRPGRYHAGIDLRTGGEEGWPVIAIGDGYVMRASTSYYGYGRALYLKLDDGRVAVYGHLQSFGPQVTRLVRARQHDLGRYSTNEYFDRDLIRVSRGMTIARSGQTGAGAPHLHFELRTGDNDPLNPLLHGMTISDRRDPEIRRLWLIPGYEAGVPGAGAQGYDPQLIPLSGSARAPLRVAGGAIRASGPIGFAVEAYDRKPGSSPRTNITGLLLVVGGDTVFQARFDTLNFASMSQIALERLMWLDNDGDTYALFKRHGNRLEHSRTHPAYPTGMIHLKPGDSARSLTIVVTDERGNRRTILGRLAYGEPPASPATEAEPVRVTSEFLELDLEDASSRPLVEAVYSAGLTEQLVRVGRRHRLYAADCSGQMAWEANLGGAASPTFIVPLLEGRVGSFSLPDSSITIDIPADAVYGNAFMTVTESRGADGQPVWRLGPENLVLRRALGLSFAVPEEPRWSLWTIAPDNGKPGFVEKVRSDGRIRCTAGGVAAYTLGVDTLPPELRNIIPQPEQTVRPDVLIRAQITDDLSGVGNDTMITVRIDGELIIPEYDPETDRLTAEPWQPLAPGFHTLDLTVEDWAGNRTVRSHRFRVIKR